MKHTISLCENNRFRALYSHGKTAAATTIAVYAKKNRLKNVSRLGLTTSVKIGCAVERNSVRRKLREAYRLHESEFRAGYDIVIVARVRSTKSTYKDIENDMLRLFKKLSLMGDNNEKSGD